MNHPHGPYRQGAPWQPGYPQPAHPPHNGYPGGYPYPPARRAGPSSGTATTAAVFAGLGVLPMLGLGVLLLIALAEPEPEPAWPTTRSNSADVGTAIFAVAAVAVILAGILLAIGALTLMRRKMVGRWLVAAGSAIAILISLLILGAFAALMGHAAGVAIAFNAPVLLGLIFPIATLVLVLLPSTAAWIRARPNVPAPPHRPPYHR